MNSKDIFNKTDMLGNRIKMIESELNKINQQLFEMMTICPHEIVFKYKDYYPKLIPVDGNYYCPACAKVIRLINKKDIEKTPFRYSRIIPLTNISLLGTSDVHNTIRYETFNNMELYYNPSIPTEELSKKMEEVLVDKETKYEYTNIKTKKNIKKK